MSIDNSAYDRKLSTDLILITLLLCSLQEHLTKLLTDAEDKLVVIDF